jgi:polyprenyl-phospho-N-acetylgalactosaminyl synthase
MIDNNLNFQLSEFRPVSDGMKVFIIIPCWNNAEHLAKIISEVKLYGQVVVIDDGSSDYSFDIAKKSGAVALKHIINRGQGAALETGDRYALSQGADLVVHFDADGQHLAKDIPVLIQPIIEGRAEIVLGSRFLNQQNKTPFFKKWFILKPANFFQNRIFDLKLTDAQNGLRAMSVGALKRIKITQDRYAHCSEIVEQIKRFKYQEVPVTVLYRDFGQNFFGGLKILFDLLIGKLNK